jgi:hypothetical protein
MMKNLTAFAVGEPFPIPIREGAMVATAILEPFEREGKSWE